MAQKSLPVSVRLSQQTKEALEEAAKADLRSVSSMIEKIVTEYLTKHGFLPK